MAVGDTILSGLIGFDFCELVGVSEHLATEYSQLDCSSAEFCQDA